MFIISNLIVANINIAKPSKCTITRPIKILGAVICTKAVVGSTVEFLFVLFISCSICELRHNSSVTYSELVDQDIVKVITSLLSNTMLYIKK